MRINKYLYPFLIISVLHLVSILLLIESTIMFTKPLIVFFLLFYFRKSVIKSPFNKLVSFALICSLIGDVALMNQQSNEAFFIIGLGFFLLVQIGYAFINFNLVNDHERKIRIAWQDIPIIITGFTVFLLIKDGIGDLRIPVLCYIVVITFMAITARQRYNRCDKQSFWLIMAGVLFFMLSDTLLAMNKFLAPIENERFWIMLTYVVAQFLIVEGIIVFIQKIRPEAGS